MSTPVPAHVLLAHEIRKTKVASARADADLEHATVEAAELRARVGKLEAEYRAAKLVTA